MRKVSRAAQDRNPVAEPKRPRKVDWRACHASNRPGSIPRPVVRFEGDSNGVRWLGEAALHSVADDIAAIPATWRAAHGAFIPWIDAARPGAFRRANPGARCLFPAALIAALVVELAHLAAAGAATDARARGQFAERGVAL